MRECCEQQANREVIERREDVVVERCKECGAKHYELSVDPIVIGVRGSDLG